MTTAVNISSKHTWNSVLQHFSQQNWKNMYYFALQLCKNKTRAEDVTQTALLRAVKYFPNFAQTQFNASSPTDCNFILQNPDKQLWLRNWLMKIVKNVFLNDAVELEKWSRSEEISDHENALAASNQTDSHDFALYSSSEAVLPENFSLLESSFFREAADDSMKLALEILNPRQKSVLFLIAEGYSYKEVSSILEIPMGTVMSSLSRTIAKVKNQLQKISQPAIYEQRDHGRFLAGEVKHASP